MHIGNWFLRLGVLFGIAGILLGNVMGATGQFEMRPVHAHLNLLGWVAMTLFGLFYRAVPAAMAGKLAKAHFWIFVPAHVVQMIALTLFLRGAAAAGPVLGLSSALVGVAFLCFAVLVWQHTGRDAA